MPDRYMQKLCSSRMFIYIVFFFTNIQQHIQLFFIFFLYVRMFSVIFFMMGKNTRLVFKSFTIMSGVSCRIDTCKNYVAVVCLYTLYFFFTNIQQHIQLFFYFFFFMYECCRYFFMMGKNTRLVFKSFTIMSGVSCRIDTCKNYVAVVCF